MQQIDEKGGVNLKGAAIGDGCWGNTVGMLVWQLTLRLTIHALNRCGPANASTRISANFYYG